jgi:hypothetical protein
MNQHFFSIKNVVKQLFIAGLIAFVSLPVFANKYKQRVEAENYPRPTIQVSKADESTTILMVQFDTNTPAKYDIIIRDEAGNLIYRKTYQTSTAARQFKLVEEPESSGSNLSVEIQLADGKQFNYLINNTIDVVKDTRVSRL